MPGYETYVLWTSQVCHQLKCMRCWLLYVLSLYPCSGLICYQEKSYGLRNFRRIIPYSYRNLICLHLMSSWVSSVCSSSACSDESVIYLTYSTISILESLGFFVKVFSVDNGFCYGFRSVGIVFINLDISLCSIDFIEALKWNVWLIDPGTRLAHLMEVTLWIPFFSTVTVCLVICGICCEQYISDSSSSYSLTLLQVDNVTNGGRFFKTNFWIEYFDVVIICQSKYFLSCRRVWPQFPDDLEGNVAVRPNDVRSGLLSFLWLEHQSVFHWDCHILQGHGVSR